MATVTVVLKVRVAWWLKVYLWLLTQLCMAVGTEPDWDKLNRVVARGVRVKA